MDIVKGIVSHNASPLPDGSFFAVFLKMGAKPVRVYMTSPFYKLNGGGQLAIPERGDQILAMYDSDSDEMYYQSTILRVDPEYNNTELSYFQVVPKTMYNKGGKPVKVYYQNALGSGLEITRNYDPTPGSTIVDSVVMKSEKGKKIALDDSPGLDAVFVRNQHGDGLTIKGDADNIFPSRITTLKSNGSQFYTCFEGQMELTVVDGRDIIIANNSTGSMSKTPSLDFWPNGPTEQPPKRYGGVYLRSENGDVSISSQALDGRIFIVTPKGRIQITEDGSIQIDSESDIQIRSSGDISMKADGDLKLEGANVDINATGSLTTTGGSQVSILSGGNLSADAAAINLQTGVSQAAQSPTIESNNLNDYNE
jgi:hypothetical protein